MEARAWQSYNYQMEAALKGARVMLIAPMLIGEDVEVIIIDWRLACV